MESGRAVLKSMTNCGLQEPQPDLTEGRRLLFAALVRARHGPLLAYSPGAIRRQRSASHAAPAGLMSNPRRVVHVFPYDPRQLGQTFERWAEAQLERWPLAAVRLSAHAPRSTVHVVGSRSRRMNSGGLEVIEHRSLASGPRHRDWGDDWSASLGRALARLNSEDACVIHLNDYAAARLAQRAARRSRVVIVFHGRGLGAFDEHLASADRLVVLREDAAAELRARGARASRIAVLPPSVDRSRFSPGGDVPTLGGPVRLGFIGRLEASKGVQEIPRVLARLTAEGFAARAELAGPFTAGQRAALEQAAARAGVSERMEILDELHAVQLAERMREWRILLLPSYTEGHPLVALEACACRLPVAAVEGVLPGELERRPAVSAAARERYPELVLRLLRDGRRPPHDDWVRDHQRAAAEWDDLLDGLPSWEPRARPAVSRLRRLRRLRIPRRVARRILRRAPIGH